MIYENQWIQHMLGGAYQMDLNVIYVCLGFFRNGNLPEKKSVINLSSYWPQCQNG